MSQVGCGKISRVVLWDTLWAWVHRTCTSVKVLADASFRSDPFPKGPPQTQGAFILGAR